MFRFKAIFLSALVGGALAATPVLAGDGPSTCYDVGAFDRENPGTGITRNYAIEGDEIIEFDVDFRAGDKVQVRVTSTAYFITAYTDIGGVDGLGTHTFKSDTITQVVELTEDENLITVSLSPVDGYAEGSVTLYCDGPPVDDGSDGEESEDDSFGAMQDGIVNQSSNRATEMITSLVHDSIEAAYAGASEPSGSLMGYAGTVVVTEPLDDLGSSIWAGLKYHWTSGDDEQWTGGQLTGVGGVNFRLDDGWVVGIFGGRESSGYTLKSLDQEMTGSGYSLGLSTAYRHENLQFELVGYGSRLAYELKDSGIGGSVEAWRYVVDGKVTGTVALSSNVDLEPMAGLAVVRERHDAYVDAADAAHEARDYLAGRATAGGRLVYYPTNGGLTLSTGGYVDYWATENRANSGATGRVEIGAAFDFAAMSSLGLNAGFDGIGGDQLGATVDASLKVGF